MQFARTLMAMLTLASGLAVDSPNASGLAVTDARALVAVVETATSGEPVQAMVEPLVTVGYPSIQVANVTVYAVDAAGLDEGRTAVERMESAGFGLPPVDVFVHPTRHGCARSPGDLTRAGVYIQRADGDVVHACGGAFPLAHELAHVWEVAALTDADRAAFLGIRDADYWSGPDWDRAGGEHAADVIAWAMLDGRVRPSQTLPNDDTSLRQAYDLLAGF